MLAYPQVGGMLLGEDIEELAGHRSLRDGVLSVRSSYG
jgi:hypothetical protein